jgi:hypothetical protein
LSMLSMRLLSACFFFFLAILEASMVRVVLCWVNLGEFG